MILGEKTVSSADLHIAFVQRMAPAEIIPIELGQRVSAAVNQIDLYMGETFQERHVIVRVEPDRRRMDGAIRARAVFSTGDLLYEAIPGGEVSDFATVPPGSYAVHLDADEPEDAPGRYVITLFDHRP